MLSCLASSWLLCTVVTRIGVHDAPRYQMRLPLLYNRILPVERLRNAIETP